MNQVAPIEKKQRSPGFQLEPSNFQEATQMAEMLAKSQMVPKHYQGKTQDTLVAMMMGSELGLNPIQSLQHIAVINGKPSIYGDALVALVQNHPAFGGIEEWFDDQTMTAHCRVWRKGGKKHEQTFSKQDAEHAQLWGKQGPWQTYPKRMLQMRARGFALRDQFADALAGLITAEEAEDYPEERDMGPARKAEPETTGRPALEQYPQEDFEANFPKWKGAIEAGKRSAEQIIAMVSSKGELTDEQKQQIRAVEAEGEE